MDLESGPASCPDLESLRLHVGDCVRCPLSETRQRLVFGSGDPHAEIMFIGEAPGRTEDLTGLPFVGAAGKLLDELLGSIGFTRDQVYIANVVKCRPPGNRDPRPIEIATCTPFLARQIELVDPVVIVTLGKFATHYLLDTAAPISSLRGRLYRVSGRPVVPVFHPAAALYDASKRDVLADDFRRIRAVIDRETATRCEQARQLSLLDEQAAHGAVPPSIVTSSEEETRRAGAALAALACTDDVVGLVGGLGAGKTSFVQGIAEGLGITGRVPSPTFNILLEHRGGRLPLFHLDLYRLERAEQLEDIDMYETMESGGLSAVEWSDRFAAEMPDDYLELRFDTVDDTHRRLTPVPHGTRSRAWAEQWLRHESADGARP